MLRDDFTERLMLAVTEVNKCASCSYAHTKTALETGMSMEEINAMLSGNLSVVGPKKLPAILFAQHYADSRGKPSKEAWNSIVKQYGNEKSLAILGAIRIIMLGNAYEIPLGSFKARLSKKPGKTTDPRSSIWYELAMLGTFKIFSTVSKAISHFKFSCIQSFLSIYHKICFLQIIQAEKRSKAVDFCRRPFLVGV